MQVLIVLLGLIALAYCKDEVRCVSDSQCGSDECCGMLLGPLIMSRRAVLDGGQIEPFGETRGTCKKYNLEGERCNMWAKNNGYCGCKPGLSCLYVRTGIRSAPAFPGYFHCARRN